jgi:Uma2 family endonuclease
MIHANLIEQILDLADAPLLHQQIGVKLAEEKIRREKFYNDIDESMKVEFINGETIVHSPVMKRHNEANGLLFHLLDIHVRKNKLGFVGIEKIMVVFTRNDYEPDLVFFNNDKAEDFKPTQTLFPVPDFVVEVLSKGTKKHDRGIKYDDYETHKVQEYWIIDPDNEVVEQYILQEDVYELVYKSSQGMIKSVVVKDFEIPIRAIFDAEINFEVLQKMMQS